MAEAGKGETSYQQYHREFRNTILMVGYCEPHSLEDFLQAKKK
jgi:hypothetical protein